MLDFKCWDWGLGTGDRELGIGNRELGKTINYLMPCLYNAQCPMPNAQSPNLTPSLNDTQNKESSTAKRANAKHERSQ